MPRVRVECDRVTEQPKHDVYLVYAKAFRQDGSEDTLNFDLFVIPGSLTSSELKRLTAEVLATASPGVSYRNFFIVNLMKMDGE